MSDEESFVILGTSPDASLVSGKQQVDNPGSNFSSFRSLRESALAADTSKNTLMPEEKRSLENSNNAEASTNGHTMVNSNIWQKHSDDSTEKTSEVSNSLTNGHTVHNSADNGVLGQNHSAPNSLGAAAAPDSLAASFILGEVNADVLKTSVYSQFPSLCSMEACAEDVVKLQTLMSDYVELKKALANVNTTMRQFYLKTQHWKDDMQRYQQQLQECQQQVAELRNENLELKRDINTKIEQVKITDEMRQKEHDELVQANSEKTSIIENMRAQIIKLEQQQLASYEYIPKNKTDSKENPDYVDRLEHQRVVKQFERQLSEVVAKNLDLTDVQKQYIDEITCLKVNYVAAEELIKNLQSEINLLKADNMEKSATFTEFQMERNEIKEELAVLRQQVDVYSRDFEMERNARQNLAGEKEQLLQDLRILQRKNQDLIEEAQKQYEESVVNKRRSSNASSIKASSPSAAKFECTIKQRPIRVLPEPSSSSASAQQQAALHRCPICSKQFKNLSFLTSHVNDCLDKN